MTNKEKTLAPINVFTSRDSEKAKELLAPGYIQYDLTYSTDVDAFVGNVACLASDPVKTAANSVRALEDEDKVFLQTVYNFVGAGEQVAFNVSRFDANGKTAEHRDNLAAKAEPNPFGYTQVDGYNPLEDLDKTEGNRGLIKNFLSDVIQGKAPEETPFYSDGDAYIQHNADIADGLPGLGMVLETLGKQGIQMIYDTAYQVLTEKNYVLAISEGSLGGAPTPYYDLWRIKDGKIAEHWDIMETIAEKDTWQNQNGKFQYNYPNYVRPDVERKVIQKLTQAGLRNGQVSGSSLKKTSVMTAKSYLEYIAREIHTTIVATVDDEGSPVMATTDMMAASEHGLYLPTTKNKGFYDRLIKR